VRSERSDAQLEPTSMDTASGAAARVHPRS
jgi:hypothetical protein